MNVVMIFMQKGFHWLLFSRLDPDGKSGSYIFDQLYSCITIFVFNLSNYSYLNLKKRRSLLEVGELYVGGWGCCMRPCWSELAWQATCVTSVAPGYSCVLDPCCGVLCTSALWLNYFLYCEYSSCVRVYVLFSLLVGNMITWPKVRSARCTCFQVYGGWCREERKFLRP